MRHSFFYLQHQVEVDVLENGGTWRWAFIIDGHGPSVTSRDLVSTAASGLQEACAVARTAIAQPLIPKTKSHV
jgi:hypothetical protein